MHEKRGKERIFQIVPCLYSGYGAGGYDRSVDFILHRQLLSALAGLIVGIIVAWFEKGLLIVALSSCGAVLAVELILRYVIQ